MRTQDEDFDGAKVIVSFIIVPAVPAILFACFFLSAYPPRSVSDSDSAAIFGMVFLLAYLVASAHVLVLGVPAFLLGKRLNAIQSGTCILAGFVIGGAPITLYGRVGWEGFIPWGLLGASGGFAFWLLWKFWIRLDP